MRFKKEKRVQKDFKKKKLALPQREWIQLCCQGMNATLLQRRNKGRKKMMGVEPEHISNTSYLYSIICYHKGLGKIDETALMW